MFRVQRKTQLELLLLYNLLGEKLSFAEYLETLYVAFRTAFTWPAITQPKVNGFG